MISSILAFCFHERPTECFQEDLCRERRFKSPPVVAPGTGMQKRPDLNMEGPFNHCNWEPLMGMSSVNMFKGLSKLMKLMTSLHLAAANFTRLWWYTVMNLLNLGVLIAWITGLAIISYHSSFPSTGPINLCKIEGKM